MEKDLKYYALQQIGDLAPEGMIIYNLPLRKVVYANASALHLIGITDTELVGSFDSLLDIVIPQDRDYLMNCVSLLQQTSVSTDIELRLKRTTADEIHICCNAYLICEKEDLVLYVKDITKPKQHESYLVEFGAKKNTLLDTLGHQISGALNLMKNLSAEAEKSMANLDRESVIKYLGLMNENSKHCIQIINDLMRDEHSQSPHIFVKTSRTDIVQIVSFIVEELKQSYKNRIFRLTHSAPSIFAVTDEVKLLQIVNNLMSNALKFSHNEKVIDLKVTENKNDITIQVTDQGIGIPDSLKPLVFERHSGAGRTGLKGEKSIGVGLSICKHLTELIRGKIWFESEEGKGSTFFVQIPKS